MSASRFAVFCLPILFLATLAGCVSDGAEVKAATSVSADAAVDPSTPEELEAAPGYVTGLVVDPEIVPVFEADVTLSPGDHVTRTNAAGAFRIGPLSEGTYTLHAEKRGYVSADAEVAVKEDRPTQMTLTLEPLASDVPYHETLTEGMYLICHVVLPNPTSSGTILNAPCGGVVDLVAGTTNIVDKWKFPFRVEKPGFASLAMEMTWRTQQFGKDGLMQLSYLGKAEVNQGGGVTVAGTVYGDSMANPFHAIIHAGNSYWRSGGKDIVFYPNPNETAKFEMLIAGGGGNTTVNNLALFIEFRPTAYLTLFYNRRALPDFSILPDK